MAEPTPKEDFNGQVRIRCDYETYLMFYKFSEDYYNYEHALSDLLRVADEKPRLFLHGDADLDHPQADDGDPGWG